MHRRESFFALIASGISLVATGCGPSLVKVNGIIKLDGTPVEGATVTFISEDGKSTYSGFSSTDGTFSLVSGDKPGAPAGTYKVIVVKIPKVEGVESMTPGSAEYQKMMEKQQKTNAPKPGPVMPGQGGTSGPKSLLPSIYNSALTTPITVKLPADVQPIPIDLKAKP